MLAYAYTSSSGWLAVEMVLVVLGLIYLFRQREAPEDVCADCDETNSKWFWRVLAAGSAGKTCVRCGKNWKMNISEG